MKVHLCLHKSRYENVRLIIKRSKSNYLIKILRVQHIHFQDVHFYTKYDNQTCRNKSEKF